ncbi:MAG TPA: aldolase [Ramlibacter sp.]|nr:aldolase [Ramlibacter sp.]
MNEAASREDICRVGKSLFDRGYVHATAGNISVRLDDAFLITPTDACLGLLDPAEISKVDTYGNAVSGARPSKTLALHRAIYDAAPNARCVIHSHSTNCVALTLSPVEGDLLPPITPYFVMKVGHVPVIPYHRPGDPKVAERVAAQIDAHAKPGAPIRAVMLSRLGPTVWHETPAQAMAVLEELEETAKLWRTADPKPLPLTAAQIEELRQAFGCSW